ncbi:DNA sulfur modification protein DndB [Kitasatospora aureofaciens]|uniref:DNA sulfur modification protein DndB n=1 Tax=Kitasatospora aureofaciens TaxID=1894 RepID=UPI0033CFC8C1
MADNITIDGSRLRGVQRSSVYLAHRSEQGGRVVYSIRPPLADLTVILPIPDSENPDEDNRQVNSAHARGFGQYLDGKPDWVAPPLLARDSGACIFKPVDGAEGAIGYLEVPWVIGTIQCLSTIDGQHRILGVHLEQQRISKEIAEIDRDLRRAISPDKIAKLTEKRDQLIAQLDRLSREHVGLDIYVERDNIKARQMFVDVADNAMGIKAAVRARFDGYKVANRTLSDVMRHAMLKGHVDFEQDRMTAKNPNFIGAKHVADITRAVIVGPGGRIGKRTEAEISDGAVIEAVTGFLDVISEAFADLADMTEGRIDAVAVRSNSLLGSVGMLRVLGGVYRNLTEDDVEQEEIKDFFKKLDRHMTAPVDDASVWRKTAASEHFEPGAKAPIMRTQNLVALTTVITSWYRKPPAAL